MNLEPHIFADFENYFILYKPPGWFVHPPSDQRALKQFRNFILTDHLQKKLGYKPFPVHRLDFGTEGLLIWAKTSEAAGKLSRLNELGQITKLYQTVIRGFIEPETGVIEIPLLSDSSFDELECRTEYQTIAHFEHPKPINSKFPSSRYALLEVRLHTGRWHQIRRHMNRVAHPIVGDREHGDSHHNRFFRDELKIQGLLLKAYKLHFVDPFTNGSRTFVSPVTDRWVQVMNIFNKKKID